MDANDQPADAAVTDTSYSTDAALRQPEEEQSGAEADTAPDVQALAPALAMARATKSTRAGVRVKSRARARAACLLWQAVAKTLSWR